MYIGISMEEAELTLRHRVKSYRLALAELMVNLFQSPTLIDLIHLIHPKDLPRLTPCEANIVSSSCG